MALINCPECGRSVSTAAASCPGCGHPIGDKSGRMIDSNVAGKAVTGLAAWLIVPWVARALFAIVGVIALFTFLGTR